MFILLLLYLLHLFFTSFVFIATETFRRESKLTQKTRCTRRMESKRIAMNSTATCDLTSATSTQLGSAQADAQSKKEAPRSMH